MQQGRGHPLPDRAAVPRGQGVAAQHPEVHPHRQQQDPEQEAGPGEVLQQPRQGADAAHLQGFRVGLQGDPEAFPPAQALQQPQGHVVPDGVVQPDAQDAHGRQQRQPRQQVAPAGQVRQARHGGLQVGGVHLVRQPGPDQVPEGALGPRGPAVALGERGIAEHESGERRQGPDQEHLLHGHGQPRAPRGPGAKPGGGRKGPVPQVPERFHQALPKGGRLAHPGIRLWADRALTPSALRPPTPPLHFRARPGHGV